MECKIKDDDEIVEEEKQRYNFRRFTQEELNKKNSPFERFKKKEYPFLFQKKKVVSKESTSISLNEIIEKVKDLSFNSPPLSFINNTNTIEPIDLYVSHTPPYPPFDNYVDLCGNVIPILRLDPIMDVDEQK